VQNDVRAVLQYVPQFRGRLFVVSIEAGKLPESAVAESLLDLAALEDLGVKLVLLVLGEDVKDFYEWGLECEIRVAIAGELTSSNVVKDAKEILARGQVPVIDASGFDALNEKVVDFVLSVGAVKLISLLESTVLVNGAPMHAILASEVQNCIDLENVSESKLLLDAAIACNRGVSRVHILDGGSQGILVNELFSNEGVGTMVYADSYRLIRAIQTEDIPELLGMIGRSVRRSFLVPRNYEEIEKRLSDYWVMLIDDNVVGCIALHEYPENSSAEIACLYVKQSHEGRGYGQDLVEFAEQKALHKNIAKVFALTNRAADFFDKVMNYKEVSREILPEERRKILENSKRESRIFEKIFTLND
jgi:amino-acid N-acetyltransferase